MQRPDDVFMRRGRESRHIRSYEDDEDSQQGLDLNPPGVAQKNGIARLYLQSWQQLALKTFRDKATSKNRRFPSPCKSDSETLTL